MKKYVFKPYSEIFPDLFDKEKERILTDIKTALLIEYVEVLRSLTSVQKSSTFFK